ncbi:unnamed protein product [Clonostachys byssicola]|uniref:Small ribosomal subunit protein mS41 n=1 Tax=Clonostachys byssicola TaxID=160290 RepID=A0A9N9UVY1_9HYPO|nr:unnamed protein product [Clonostachys byssicola]
MKLERLRPCLRMLAPSNNFTFAGQIRSIHQTRRARKIPEPKPFVPDVTTFLTLIGRGLNKYANKFPSWDSLFSLTGPQLKELGIEPARSRRYLLNWMKRYRKGDLGPGGDFLFVKDGEAILRAATLQEKELSGSKFVVNVPHPDEEVETPAEIFGRPLGYVVRGAKSIAGPYATPLPGSTGVSVKVTEGMWEDRRGRKIDGGERRRAEIRFKKRSAERRAQREAEFLGH